MNTIKVWFDMHHYSGIDDPDAQIMIERLRAILGHAKSLGIQICLGGLGNEAFKDSPVELRANYRTGRASYEVELCPNKPGSMELLLKWHRQVLESFIDIEPDFITICPYDQGGCACENCKPWGANGFLKIARAKAQLTRELLPNIKVILHTWLFDYNRDQGEWSGLAKAFSVEKPFVDYVQADSHEDFPPYILKNGVPGNLPLINFPEISMWMMFPWGGFGANPLPQRFYRLHKPIKNLVSGGFPYSEGNYEDINKVLCLRWYWDAEASVDEILRDYIAYEYSPSSVEDVLEIIDILETNHNHHWPIHWGFLRQLRMAMQFKADPHRAFTLAKRVDKSLSKNIRNSWRWRILYLRAEIDALLQPTEGFWGGDRCEEAFVELTKIYHAENAEYKCAPPTKSASENCRSSEWRV